jgi:hypothetical protein
MATTTVPFRSPSGQATSRRALLQGAGHTAGFALALGVPAAIAGEPADPHLAWFAEWQRLVDWCDGAGPGDRDLQDCPEWHQSFEIEQLIATTPARTLAGALCQLRLARYYTSASHTGENADYAVENALASLERLAGGQAHV